jgi:hypothetical protein
MRISHLDLVVLLVGVGGIIEYHNGRSFVVWFYVYAMVFFIVKYFLSEITYSKKTKIIIDTLDKITKDNKNDK